MSRDAGANERVESAMRGGYFGRIWIRASCPFCEDEGHRDRKNSLAINAGSGGWFCHRCGTRGKLDEPPDPAVAIRAAEEEAREIEAIPPPHGFTLLGDDHSLTFSPARRYLRSRGLTRKQMRDMQIGACAQGYWAGRIIVPFVVSTLDGWYGWVGRIWTASPSPHAEGADEKKYLYPSGMRRGLLLYNHDELSVETDTPLMIMEGVFDTFPFGRGAAAVLGKPSHKQVDALSQASRPIAVVLDGDAWVESHALSMRLQFDGARAGCVRLPPRTDPDEVDRAALIQAAHDCIGKFEPVKL
jgi:hypothetical protein